MGWMATARLSVGEMAQMAPINLTRRQLSASPVLTASTVAGEVLVVMAVMDSQWRNQMVDTVARGGAGGKGAEITLYITCNGISGQITKPAGGDGGNGGHGGRLNGKGGKGGLVGARGSIALHLSDGVSLGATLFDGADGVSGAPGNDA